MAPEISDAELIARSVAEPAVFAGLYERHGLVVRRYAAQRIGDEAGDDIASEVFIRAFRARHRYRVEHDSARPWLLVIANNAIADQRRLERRRMAALERLSRQTPEVLEHRDPGLDPELVVALRALPGTERDALLLMVWGELTQEQVAAVAGVPVGTVSSRITRARKRLAATPLRRPPSPRVAGVQPEGT